MPGAAEASHSCSVAALAASNCGTFVAAACSSSHGADVAVVWQCETSGRGGLTYSQTAVVVCFGGWLMIFIMRWCTTWLLD